MNVCKHCGKEFDPITHKGRRLFCSATCRSDYENAPQKVEDKPQGLSNGSMGAFSELIVCADLLAKGYEVFRAVSPACSCDVVAIKKRKKLRFEVRTARRVNSGLIWAKTNFRADHFAIVVGKDVVYDPALEEL